MNRCYPPLLAITIETHDHKGPTFSLQLDNMLIMLRQTDCTERAGDQSSVSIDRQMWPLLYTWGWIGIFSPVNTTCSKKTKKTKRYSGVTKSNTVKWEVNIFHYTSRWWDLFLLELKLSCKPITWCSWMRRGEKLVRIRESPLSSFWGWYCECNKIVKSKAVPCSKFHGRPGSDSHLHAAKT